MGKTQFQHLWYRMDFFFHFRMSMNMNIYRFGDTVATKAHIKLLNGVQNYVSFI